MAKWSKKDLIQPVNKYWLERMAETQSKLADKTIDEVNTRLKKYYSISMKRVIKDFELTYEKILNAVKDGKQPTPADLYKLDNYWKMQSQLKAELQKLGDKESELLSKAFEKEWVDIYNATALPSDKSFATVNLHNAKEMINQVWLTDGKTWSERVWNNVERLAETLNEELIDAVVTGRSTRELKHKLMQRFNVSYARANTLVKTEVTHIQTQAAAQRYQDYGLDKYKFFADTDEKTCSKCADLDGRVFYFSEMVAGKNAPPMHPNDRCAIIAIVED